MPEDQLLAAARVESADQCATEPAPDPNADLGREKLRLEIRDLKKSSWTQPGTIIPLLATVITLGLSWVFGVFDVRRDRIQVESDRLEVRRQQLAEQVNSLDGNRRSLQAQIDGLSAELKDKQGQLAQREQQISEMRDVLSMPLLQIDTFVQEPDDVSIDLHNTGKGTAVIQQLREYVSGIRMERGPRGRAGTNVAQALGLGPEVMWDWYTGNVTAGESKKIWWIEPGDAKDERNVEEFQKALPKMGLEVCYCSLLSDQKGAPRCYWATLNRPTPPDKCS